MQRKRLPAGLLVGGRCQPAWVVCSPTSGFSIPPVSCSISCWKLRAWVFPDVADTGQQGWGKSGLWFWKVSNTINREEFLDWHVLYFNLVLRPMLYSNSWRINCLSTTVLRTYFRCDNDFQWPDKASRASPPGLPLAPALQGLEQFSCPADCSPLITTSPSARLTLCQGLPTWSS